MSTMRRLNKNSDGVTHICNPVEHDSTCDTVRFCLACFNTLALVSFARIRSACQINFKFSVP